MVHEMTSHFGPVQSGKGNDRDMTRFCMSANHQRRFETRTSRHRNIHHDEMRRSRHGYFDRLLSSVGGLDIKVLQMQIHRQCIRRVLIVVYRSICGFVRFPSSYNVSNRHYVFMHSFSNLETQEPQ